MPRKAAQKPLEPSEKSPQGWARWWFAMGCQQPGTVRRLVTECGLQEAEAESIFKEMMEKLAAEVEDLRQNFAARSEALYRDIKNDPAGDWSTRQRAQIELEQLLDLVAFAQTVEGLRSIDVLEAIAFHETLIDDATSTASQRLRSQRRLMMLLGQTQCRRARSRATSTSFPGATSGLSTGARSTQTSDISPVPLQFVPQSLPPRASMGDPEIDAATRREVLAALEQEADELEAEFERLVDAEGVSPDDALERLEPLMHETSLRQIALRGVIAPRDAPADPSPSPAPPVPHAQGPPA